MKEWIVTGLVLIGGYVVVQWILGQRRSPAGQNAANAAIGANVGPISAVIGVGDYYVSPLASGVPAFNTSPVANGHGDLVIAAYHTNPMATIPGQAVYQPAFGPNENQPSGAYLPVGLA